MRRVWRRTGVGSPRPPKWTKRASSSSRRASTRSACPPRSAPSPTRSSRCSGPWWSVPLRPTPSRREPTPWWDGSPPRRAGRSIRFRPGRRRWPGGRGGQGLYAASGAAGHGANGGGDGPLAASLSVRPPALRDLAAQARFSDDELVELILRGRPGSPMPGFARAIDSASAEKLVAFLRVLPTAERQHYVASPAAAIFATVQSQVDSAVALRSSQLAFDAYITFEQVETEVRARNSALASDLEDAFAALRARAAG